MSSNTTSLKVAFPSLIPNNASKESIKIDFPAPEGPVKTTRPFLNSKSTFEKDK